MAAGLVARPSPSPTAEDGRPDPSVVMHVTHPSCRTWQVCWWPRVGLCVPFRLGGPRCGLESASSCLLTGDRAGCPGSPRVSCPRPSHPSSRRPAWSGGRGSSAVVPLGTRDLRYFPRVSGKEPAFCTWTDPGSDVRNSRALLASVSASDVGVRGGCL